MFHNHRWATRVPRKGLEKGRKFRKEERKDEKKVGGEEASTNNFSTEEDEG